MSTTPLLDRAKQASKRLATSEIYFDIDAGELYVYGVIEAQSAKTVLDFLREMKGKRVLVRINSPGGSVDSGTAIYNSLAGHRGGCNTVVDSLAASMASLIFMAGSRRMVYSNSKIMLHSPWTQTSGNASDLRKEIDVLEKYETSMTTAYSKRTGKTPEEIRKWLAAETWLTGQEIIDEGFATEMVGHDAQSRSLSTVYARRMVDRLDNSSRFELPVNLNSALRSKIAKAKAAIDRAICLR